jgi:uncharacterized iron-regulated membrane protein
MNIHKTIFWTHLVVGITIGAVVLFLSVTGMMLSFRPQIVSIVEQGKYDTVAAQKNSPVRLFMKKVEGFHRWFGVEGPFKAVAHQVKGIVTILFLGMLASGMYLWFPRKVMKIKDNVKDGQARDWYRHNTFGFWTAPLLIIITITGLLMMYLPSPSKSAAGQPEASLRQFKKFVRTVHTGEVGGFIGQVIVFTATSGTVVLVCTGFSMASRRLFKRKSRQPLSASGGIL